MVLPLSFVLWFSAGYRLGVSEVVVTNDEFVYDKSDIDKDSKLARTALLSKYLRIVTEVNPYILLRHEKIPPQLLPSLGINLEAFTAEYLKIPFRREGGRLMVTN